MTKPRVRVKAGRRPHLTVVPFERPVMPIARRVAEDLLKYVESGEITDFAIGFVWQDGVVGWAAASDRYKRSVIGGIELAKSHILDKIKADDQ